MADDILPTTAPDPVLAAIMGKAPAPAPTPEPDDEEDKAQPAEPAGDEQYLDEEPAAEATPAPVEVPEDHEFEVTVDGAPVKVKLADLKSSYSGNQAIDRRLQEVTQERARAFEIGSRYYNGLQAQAERLAQIDAALQSVSNNNIDWDKLRATDPQRYLIERDKQRETMDRRQAVAQEQYRIQQEQQAMLGQQREMYTQQEAERLLARMPELRVPEKAQAFMNDALATATSYGFSREELGAVVDHRQLLVLNDAAKYRALLARKAAAAAPAAAVKPLLRPGSAGGQQFSQKMAEARDYKANVAKARETGSVEDVAKLLITKVKVRR